MRGRLCGAQLILPIASAISALLIFDGTLAWADNEREHAEAVAEEVLEKAERTEPAEGELDLVDDTVTVKSDAKGKPVIEQRGEASFYRDKFHGHKTASGERFDQRDMTAAHPTLPLGATAKVTNLETGQSVQVKINDRGPYAKGRNIDLSKSAAQKIGMTKQGTLAVKIEAKLPPEK
jgi:rare lipoprotein A (peptidoglycan hydrolase)